MSSGTSYLGSNNITILYLDYNTGFVGVGLSNPTSQLHISDRITASNMTVYNSINALGGITLSNSTFLAPSNDTSNLPSYSWKEDCNMGMYHASNNTIGLSTNSVERLRITNMGNIGINSSNPLFLLDVNGDLNFNGTLRQGGTPYVGSQWSNVSSNVFLIGSNVGLGLSNPSAQLHLTSNLRVDGNINIYNGLVIPGFELQVSGVTANSTQIFSTTSNILGYSNIPDGLQFFITGTTSNDYIKFATGLSNIRLAINGRGDIIANSPISLTANTTPTSTSTSNLLLYYNLNTNSIETVDGTNTIKTIAYSNNVILNTNTSFYAEFVTRSNQSFFTSFCNIAYNTERYRSSEAFTRSADSPSIYMKRSTPYLYFLTINAFASSNSNTPAKISFQGMFNSNLQPGTITNMLIADQYSSGTTFMVINPTSSNDIAQFQCKVDYGNSNIITQSNNGTLLTCVNLSTQMSNLTHLYNSNSLELGTNFSNLPINSILYRTNSNISTSSNNGIKINTAGTYMVIAKTNFVSSNTSFVNIETYITKNNAELIGTRGYTYTLNSSNNANGYMTSYIDTFASNDLINIGSRIMNSVATNNVYASSNGCTLTVLQLNNVDYINATYSNTSNTPVVNSLTNIGINIITGSNSSTFSLSNSYIKSTVSTFNLVLSTLSYSNNYTSNGLIVSSVDTETTYGQRSFAFVNSNGLNSRFIHKIANTPYNSGIGTSFANLRFTSNLSIMNTCSSTNIFTVDKPSIYNILPSFAYGNYFRSSKQSSIYQTNQSNYSRSIELNTDYLDNGLYHITSYFEYIPRCTSFNVRGTLDGSNLFERNVNSFNMYNRSNVESYHSDVLLNSNMHKIRLEFKTNSSNDFLTIQNSQIEIWQVK